MSNQEEDVFDALRTALGDSRSALDQLADLHGQLVQLVDDQEVRPELGVQTLITLHGVLELLDEAPELTARHLEREVDQLETMLDLPDVSPALRQNIHDEATEVRPQAAALALDDLVARLDRILNS